MMLYFCGFLLMSLLATGLLPFVAVADVQRTKFSTDGAYLVVEVLDDDLIHFELSAIGSGPAENTPLYTSPMVLKADYGGPTVFNRNGNVIETQDVQVSVEEPSLCVEVRVKTRRNAKLTIFCGVYLTQARKGLDIDPAVTKQVYGLGQQFRNLGEANNDWLAHGKREGHGGFGNGFQGFQSAAVGNVQIPVYYALGEGGLNYAVLLDNVYDQQWNFETSPWRVRMFGDQLRWYVITGAKPTDLRAAYMELTGMPPVPPRKAFGLWVSEFGYRNFGEIANLLNGRPADGGPNCPPEVLGNQKRNAICPGLGLRDVGFPVDGFVLDLNWFGGVQKCDDNACNQPKTHMGRLDWDQDQPPDLNRNPYSFTDPDTSIAALNADHIGLVNIEESYLANTTQTFDQIPANLTAYRRTNGRCDPHNQTQAVDNVKGFWGDGKMIDWSDLEAGTFIHDERRFPNMTLKGITAHWTDLGEPETFDDAACYEGVETTVSGLKNEHPDIHNLYNLLWNRAIWDGYVSKQGVANALGVTNPRPFIVTRSGVAGIQRYGAAMWSGDIASNLLSLATHYNAQMHMSFSGIDYYGSDIGGFRREVLPGNNNQGGYRGFEKEAFTQWLANGAWTDVPVRPHTDNEFKLAEGAPRYATSPHLVGDPSSNLANLRQRYELIPYYYSLAYKAHKTGEPLMPPPVFYYPDDPNLRGVGHQKMVGRDLMIGIVAKHGEYQRGVYLPAGRWVNYHTNEWFESTGQQVENVPVFRGGILRIPAFARAGAIIPKMAVDAATQDAFGHRTDGEPPVTDLFVRVYADAKPTSFTLFEDDGVTVVYDDKGRPSYHHRTTEISQEQTAPTTVSVTIDPAMNQNGDGNFAGAVSERHNLVELVVDGATATAVQLDGNDLPKLNSVEALQSAESGWINASLNLILAKSPKRSVGENKTFTFSLAEVDPKTSVHFVCDNGFTSPGQSVFVVGSSPELGSWDFTKAIKLDPNIYYPYIYDSPPKDRLGPDRVNQDYPRKPVWTGVVMNMPSEPSFEWKCIRLNDDRSGAPSWQPDPNNNFQSAVTSGYAGQAFGSF
jgi:alpha-glucosidase